MRLGILAGILSVMAVAALADTPSENRVPVGMSPPPALQGTRERHPGVRGQEPVPELEGIPPVRDDTDKSGAAPSLMDDFYTVQANETMEVSGAGGILANDYDPEGDTLNIVGIYPPENGTVTVFSYGAFWYTPDPGFLGFDFFDILINDGTSANILTRAHLQVVDTDRPPLAHGEFYNIRTNHTLDVPGTDGILANDQDPDYDALSVYYLQSTVQNGNLIAYTNGGFNYDPDYGFAGVDSFTYFIYANGKTARATTRIVVFEDNREPIATEDHYFVPVNGYLSTYATTGVLRNDWDPDGAPLLVNLITDNVDHGFLTHSSDGSFEYSPFIGYSGMDSFTYRIVDLGPSFATATVSIFVGIDEDDVSAVDLPADAARFGMSLPTPNPFNPTTRIDFRLEETEHTVLRVFDVRGALVRTLVDEELTAGAHSVQWDGRSDGGAPVASGTYFAALSSGEQHTSRRLALVK